MSTTTSGLQCEGTAGFHLWSKAILSGLAVALCVAVTTELISAKAVGPVAPEVKLDGRYGGTLTAAFEGRDGECARLEALPELVVTGDRAWLGGGRLTLRGAVHAGGLLVLSGALDGPAMLAGHFEGERFLGELRGWNCTYQVALTRQS